MRATRPTHIFFDLITPVIYSEVYKL